MGQLDIKHRSETRGHCTTSSLHMAIFENGLFHNVLVTYSFLISNILSAYTPAVWCIACLLGMSTY